MPETSDGDDGRWDTPCGVHHGWLFLSGACFGFLAAVCVVYLVILYV